MVWDKSLSSLQFTRLEIIQQTFPNAVVQACKPGWKKIQCGIHQKYVSHFSRRKFLKNNQMWLQD